MIYNDIDRPQMILGMHEFLKSNINDLESAIKRNDFFSIKITKENYEKASVIASRVIRPIGLEEYDKHYHRLLEGVEE
ncbi:hypothetical protein KAT80_00110 [Candidatus Pacearchaeota archaeon]|nr:hypothetical protein [Candidatus Pacearchaeota archaeon]